MAVQVVHRETQGVAVVLAAESRLGLAQSRTLEQGPAGQPDQENQQPDAAGDGEPRTKPGDWSRPGPCSGHREFRRRWAESTRGEFPLGHLIACRRENEPPGSSEDSLRFRRCGHVLGGEAPRPVNRSDEAPENRLARRHHGDDTNGAGGTRRWSLGTRTGNKREKTPAAKAARGHGTVLFRRRSLEDVARDVLAAVHRADRLPVALVDAVLDELHRAVQHQHVHPAGVVRAGPDDRVDRPPRCTPCGSGAWMW